jgi:hypothetical protein
LFRNPDEGQGSQRAVVPVMMMMMMMMMMNVGICNVTAFRHGHDGHIKIDHRGAGFEAVDWI